MRVKLVFAAVSLGSVLATAPLFGHHAFAAEYDALKPVSLSGTLTKLEWSNPHAWLHVNVKDDQGKVVNWAIEFGSPNALLRRGLRKTDFPEGLQVVVSGYRAKNGSPTANATTVKLPDGRDLFTGSSGTGAPVEGPEK
jgi:hypothetical protein